MSSKSFRLFSLDSRDLPLFFRVPERQMEEKMENDDGKRPVETDAEALLGPSKH